MTEEGEIQNNNQEQIRLNNNAQNHQRNGEDCLWRIEKKCTIQENPRMIMDRVTCGFETMMRD